MVYNSKTIFLLACLKNGLQFKNHLNTSAKQFIIIIIIHSYLENEFRTITFFCLLNFEHDSTIFPPLLLAYTFDVLDHIRQHNQLNTIRYSLCTMHYALCTMHYSVCTMHYSLCTMHYALFTMHYALCTMHYLFILVHTYLLFYTYSYVFTISHGNPTKSRDFGTHA